MKVHPVNKLYEISGCYARKTDNKRALLQLVTSVALRSIILILDEIDRVAS